MRTIALEIDDELDRAIEHRAERSGRSKETLIRECLEERYRTRGCDQGSPRLRLVETPEDDPLSALVGFLDCPAAEDIDEVVYRQ